MKYLQGDFSVLAPGTDEYREGWDRIFNKDGKRDLIPVCDSTPLPELIRREHARLSLGDRAVARCKIEHPEGRDVACAGCINAEMQDLISGLLSGERPTQSEDPNQCGQHPQPTLDEG